jgi:predicted nucleotidyltransferase
MIKQKYLAQLKDILNQQLDGEKIKIFIYGSSVERDEFRDIDIGIEGDFDERQISSLKEQLQESLLPYFIDVINFNKVSSNFKEAVFKSKILWIKD